MPFEILRKIQVLNKPALSQQLKHPGQVPDDIADRRENKPVKSFEMAVHDQLQDAPWHMADVTLIVSIPFNDQFFIPSAENAYCQAICCMHNFPWNIDWHMSDKHTGFIQGFPFFGSGEFQIKSKLFALTDYFC